MPKLLLNYDYLQYPYTTASYIEKAASSHPDIEVVRLPCPPEQLEQYYTQKPEERPDLIFNIMPVDNIPVCPAIPSCYWEIDNHLVKGTKTDFYKLVDIVFVPQEPFLKYYPESKTKILALGADPALHVPLEPKGEQYDIGFVGNDTYPIRIELLDSLAQEFKVLRTQTPPGLPYSQAFANCKMIFNHSLDNDVNMRFFEAMACAKLLLTDYLPQQDLYAKVGEHYDIYTDKEDLHRKVRYYLENEDIRENIELNARELILEKHTYEHRLLEVLSYFGYHLKPYGSTEI